MFLVKIEQITAAGRVFLASLETSIQIRADNEQASEVVAGSVRIRRPAGKLDDMLTGSMHPNAASRRNPYPRCGFCLEELSKWSNRVGYRWKISVRKSRQNAAP